MYVHGALIITRELPASRARAGGDSSSNFVLTPRSRERLRFVFLGSRRGQARTRHTYLTHYCPVPTTYCCKPSSKSTHHTTNTAQCPPHSRVRARAAPAPASIIIFAPASQSSSHHLQNHLRTFAHLGMPTSTRPRRSQRSSKPPPRSEPHPCLRASVVAGLRTRASVPRVPRAAQSSPARAHAKREGRKGEVRASLEAPRPRPRPYPCPCPCPNACPCPRECARGRVPGWVLVSPRARTPTCQNIYISFRCTLRVREDAGTRARARARVSSLESRAEGGETHLTSPCSPRVAPAPAPHPNSPESRPNC